MVLSDRLIKHKWQFFDSFITKQPAGETMTMPRQLALNALVIIT